MNLTNKNKASFSVKHLKSSSADLRNMFEHNITVKEIAEELETCDVNENYIEKLDYMKQRDFDVLGLEDDGVTCGYIKRTSLKDGVCGDYKCSFSVSELISDSTSLFDLLKIINGHERVFILFGNRVKGIITRGDLHKAPVRLLLYGQITLLEMQMLRFIQLKYPDNTWNKLIKPNRLEDAKEEFYKREKNNEAIDLASCLQLCDKRDIILKKEESRNFLGLTSKKSGNKLFKSIQKLRNNLAHAQNIIMDLSWERVFYLSKKIDEMLRKIEKY